MKKAIFFMLFLAISAIIITVGSMTLSSTLLTKMSPNRSPILEKHSSGNLFEGDPIGGGGTGPGRPLR